MILKIIAVGVIGFAAYTDMKTKKIPLWTIGLVAALSLVSCVVMVTDGVMDISEILLSMTVGGALLLVGYVSRGGIGYGDGLLLLAMGPLFGYRALVMGLSGAFILSALVSLVLITVKKCKRGTKLPFVPFIALALGVVSFAVR